jgi:hypothetical protein
MEDMVQKMLGSRFRVAARKGAEWRRVVRNLKKSNHAKFLCKFGTLTSSICNEFL